MKYLIMILGLLLAMVPITALAEQPSTDDCPLDVSALAPLIDEKSPAIEIIRPAGKQPNINYGFGQVVRIGNVTVTATAGGCAHYGYRITLDGLTIDPYHPQNALPLIEKTILSLPINRKVQLGASQAEIHNAFEKITAIKKWPGTSIEVPAGDANMGNPYDLGSYELSVGEDGSVTFGFSVIL